MGERTMDLEALDLVGAAQAVRAGQISSRQLVEHAHAVADRHDATLGVFLSRFRDESLAAADAADRALAEGYDLGPLHGVPVGVKDILSTEEGPTTAQSPAMDSIWAAGDAEVVARLRAAGAVVIGKTSTMEFAYAVPDLTHPFPVPANPWDAGRWPGGSSSGSGAGVAAGMMLGAVGTDTGGSVRVPAAMCGVSGIKPTTGLVSNHGCVPLSYTMDTIGPLARSARDCSVLLQVMAQVGFDAPPVDLKGLRIGVATMADVATDAADPAAFTLLDGAVEALVAMGATTSNVTLPLYSEVGTASHVTIAAERLTWHRRYLAERWRDYGENARTGMARGVHHSASDYVQAQRVRRKAQRLVDELFADVDVIVSPMCARTSPPRTEIADCMRTWPHLVFAMYWNALGNPAVSVPMGIGRDGLPIGLQIIGRPHADELILQVAQAYQEVTTWHHRRPDLSALPKVAVEVPLPDAVAAAAATDANPDLPLELAEHLARREGITAASPGEIASIATGLTTSRAAIESLYAVDCGDSGTAVELTYP